MAALVATFLSDAMNADPQVVKHVHECGLATSFLNLTTSRGYLPGLVSALSLTEAVAEAVLEADPFPVLLSAFVSPRYVMPNSRCLLAEMGAVVDTGLDELARHTPSLRPAVLGALVKAAKRAATLGKNLVADEDGAAAVYAAASAAPEEGAGARDVVLPPGCSPPELEGRRTRLAQYAHNLVQLTEQMLHAEDHVAAFVERGGHDAILELARWTTAPGGRVCRMSF
ncbi:hypothetical protein ACHAWF_018213 [Thalassiosira exigua]